MTEEIADLLSSNLYAMEIKMKLKNRETIIEGGKGEGRGTRGGGRGGAAADNDE